MKTLCFSESTVSGFLFSDDQVVDVTPENTIVGNPVEFIVGVMNSNNSTLWEGVQAPTDWAGCKYLFNGSTWSLNPDYLDPAAIVEP